MEIKNKNTQAQRAMASHARATASELRQVYGRYSDAKRRAMDYCKGLCARLDGWDLRILGANSMAFSVGFYFTDKGTGAVCFAYITKDYDRFFYA